MCWGGVAVQPWDGQALAGKNTSSQAPCQATAGPGEASPGRGVPALPESEGKVVSVSPAAKQFQRQPRVLRPLKTPWGAAVGGATMSRAQPSSGEHEAEDDEAGECWWEGMPRGSPIQIW